VLLVAAAGTFVNDQICIRFPKYDRWLYDETKPWNARWRERRDKGV
jgi:hypothetical protein